MSPASRISMNTSTASTAIYHELAGALRQRLAVIGDRAAYERDPQEHLRQLQAASERITALQQKLPAPVDPQLAHYLQRCSYDKALSWLRDNFSTV